MTSTSIPTPLNSKTGGETTPTAEKTNALPTSAEVANAQEDKVGEGPVVWSKVTQNDSTDNETDTDDLSTDDDYDHVELSSVTGEKEEKDVYSNAGKSHKRKSGFEEPQDHKMSRKEAIQQSLARIDAWREQDRARKEAWEKQQREEEKKDKTPSTTSVWDDLL